MGYVMEWRGVDPEVFRLMVGFYDARAREILEGYDEAVANAARPCRES